MAKCKATFMNMRCVKEVGHKGLHQTHQSKTHELSNLRLAYRLILKEREQARREFDQRSEAILKRLAKLGGICKKKYPSHGGSGRMVTCNQVKGHKGSHCFVSGR